MDYFKPGSWKSPRLTNVDIVVVIITLITQAFLRIWDYSTGTDSEEALSLVERTLPLYVWGIILGFCTVLLLIGLIFKIHFVMWLGHALSTVVYITLCFGIFLHVFTQFDPPWDGLRFASTLLIPIILHGALAIRTGPEPLSGGETCPVEMVSRHE